jgi:hypothetical protein
MPRAGIEASVGMCTLVPTRREWHQGVRGPVVLLKVGFAIYDAVTAHVPLAKTDSTSADFNAMSAPVVAAPGMSSSGLSLAGCI